MAAGMTTPAAPGERPELDRRAPENGYHGPSFWGGSDAPDQPAGNESAMKKPYDPTTRTFSV
jgi:hypothetical protein